jgi:hypothetical protein
MADDLLRRVAGGSFYKADHNQDASVPDAGGRDLWHTRRMSGTINGREAGSGDGSIDYLKIWQT